jgi:uncharacterized membrane protein
MFQALFLIAAIGPLVGFYSFWRDARAQGWDWITAESLKMYVDAAKTFLMASGIAVAIVVGSLGGKFSPPLWIVQRAVAGLVTCVVFAPITVLVLYRLYERASSRHQEAEPKDPHAQGKLNRLELALLLAMAYITAEGFILGFLYLARIPFHLAP